MSTTHVIKRGLDIPIAGAASGSPVSLPAPAWVSYTPTEFRGLRPRPAVREGDKVLRGSPLFTAKAYPAMKFASPVAGVVKEIRRGHRRVITDVVVETQSDAAETFPTFSLEQLRGIGRDAARDALLAGGVWPLLRTRPLDHVASPDHTPQAILVSAYETGPLMPGAAELLAAGDKDRLQAGLYALRALTDGAVVLAVGPDSHPALSGLDGVEVHQFQGKHPAGDPAVQVNHTIPPRGAGQVWYVRAWDVADIGRLLLEGTFPSERTYAAVGTGVKAPRLVRTVLGAPAADVVGAVADGALRWLAGSVLTGTVIGPERGAPYYSRAIHLLPDRADHEFMGWTAPQLGKFSAYRAFLSGLLGSSRRFDLTTQMYGGHRALVPFARFKDVVATPDIEPDFLFRAMFAGDLQESIKLGLLDLSMEEAALCTFVDPSKNNLDVLLKQTLDVYEQEAG